MMKKIITILTIISILLISSSFVFASTSIEEISSNNLGISTNGTEHLRIDIKGMIGVGKSNPKERLDVNGNILINQYNSDSALRWKNKDGNLSSLRYDGDSNGLEVRFNDSIADFIIEDTGQVGIGTTSPKGQLHLKNGSRNRLKGDEGIVLGKDESNNQGIELRTNKSTGDGGNYIDFVDKNISKDYEGRILYKSHSLSFYTNASEKFKINKNGNVGIGTSTPDDRLDVNGDIDLNVNSLDSAIISPYSWLGGTSIMGQINNLFIRADRKYDVTTSPNCNSGSVSQIFNGQWGNGCHYQESELPAVITIDVSNRGYAYTNDFWALMLHFPYDYSPTEYKVERLYSGQEESMSCGDGDESWETVEHDTNNDDRNKIVYVPSDGSTCKFRITLNGSSNRDGSSQVRMGSINMYAQGDRKAEGFHVKKTGDTIFGNIRVTGDTFLATDSGKQVGIGTTNPDSGYKLDVDGDLIADSTTTRSDISLKDNITSLGYGLEAVSDLEPRSFDMKEDGEDSIGFVAQEVEDVVPEVVEGEPGEKGISYSRLTAVNTKAIKELKEKNEKLREENKRLNRQVDVLKDAFCEENPNNSLCS